MRVEIRPESISLKELRDAVVAANRPVVGTILAASGCGRAVVFLDQGISVPGISIPVSGPNPQHHIVVPINSLLPYSA